jgi:RNA polymerase sigma factor (sigma-70 family)
LEIVYLPIDFSKQKDLFNKISDIDIITGVRNQDDKVLNWLYDNYFQSVTNHVSDVFQDAIIVLFNQITEDKLRLTSDLKGYFFGIARNVWNSQLRKKQKTIELEFDLPDEEETEDQSDPTLERIISKVFQRLKPDQQMVLNLFSDGLSYEEIAAKLNLKNEVYARRKKYLCKEALLELVKEDPEYQEYLRFQK